MNLRTIKRFLRKLDFITEIRHIWAKAINALSYLPMLYQGDYEFDASTCLLRIMKFKLVRARHCMETGYHRFTPALFRKMRTMEYLIDRILADDYNDNVFLHHDRKWGQLDIKFHEKVPGALTVGCDFVRPNANTKELRAQENREYRRLMNLPEQYKKQDIDLLFKLYSKNCIWWSD